MNIMLLEIHLTAIQLKLSGAAPTSEMLRAQPLGILFNIIYIIRNKILC
ncbi:hypothetical protein F975_01494 [Acinetobacter sp. ANC 3789]|nr:hypothetical protein F975_01494 [Acinetobacter sp. ANC 3789]